MMRDTGQGPFKCGGLLVLAAVIAGRLVTTIGLEVAQFIDDWERQFPYFNETCLGQPGTPALEEHTVYETAYNFAQLWAQFYEEPDFLYIQSVWQTRDGILHKVQQTTYPPGVAWSGLLRRTRPRRRAARTYDLFGRIGGPGSPGDAQDSRVLLLQHLPWRPTGIFTDVQPTSGGIDRRDQDLVGYLSSNKTGCCTMKCKRFADVAHLREWVS